MTGLSGPRPGCPARAGASNFGIDRAEFVFHAGDCRNSGNPVTEICFFCRPARQQPGSPHRGDDDAVHTAAFEVPADSPVSRLAHQANTEAGITLIGDQIRGAIAACPCRPGDRCAALDEATFLAAVERAAQSPQPTRWRRRTRGLWHE